MILTNSLRVAAELEQRMVNASERRIVLADSTKPDRIGLAPICELPRSTS
ncbi:hypothetical protein [Nonomuraea sp. NPDC005501]